MIDSIKEVYKEKQRKIEKGFQVTYDQEWNYSMYATYS